MAHTSTAHTIDPEAEYHKEIADTILHQLGRECLGLLGVTRPTVYSDDSGHGVAIDIKGSRTVNQIYITLDQGEDTYKLAFVQVTGGKLSTRTGRYVPRTARLVYSVDGLYAEDIHSCIENRTGLYVSLRPRR